jgi:hypothetical protein
MSFSITSFNEKLFFIEFSHLIYFYHFNFQILPSLILLFDGLKHAYEAQHDAEDSDEDSEDDDKVFIYFNSSFVNH